jgi:hypothetical protein
MVQDFGRRQDRSAKGLVHSRRASKAGIDDARLLDTHLTSRGIHESRKDAIEQADGTKLGLKVAKSMQVHVMTSKHLVFPQARGCNAPSVLLPFPLPCGGSKFCVTLHLGHVFRWVIATVVSLTRAGRHITRSGKADDASARGRTREAGGDALSRAVSVFVFASCLCGGSPV